jgi:hypothetical protein
MITIARGTLPLFLFGPHGYGLLQGRLAVAQRMTQAAAPFLFALLLESVGAFWGVAASFSVSLLGVAALFVIREGAPPELA